MCFTQCKIVCECDLHRFRVYKRTNDCMTHYVQIAFLSSNNHDDPIFLSTVSFSGYEGKCLLMENLLSCLDNCFQQAREQHAKLVLLERATRKSCDIRTIPPHFSQTLFPPRRNTAVSASEPRVRHGRRHRRHGNERASKGGFGRTVSELAAIDASLPPAALLAVVLVTQLLHHVPLPLVNLAVLPARHITGAEHPSPKSKTNWYTAVKLVYRVEPTRACVLPRLPRTWWRRASK